MFQYLLIMMIYILICTLLPAQVFAAAGNERLPGSVLTLPGLIQSKGWTYPPQGLALLAFKQEKRLELWVLEQNRWQYLHSYPILAASGRLGPKLKEGDRQVPEGIYQIVLLNPHSLFHLSLKLNYPNEFDLNHARREGRDGLGGDIFIHGNAISTGCLAMGNKVIEEIYYLVADTGLDKVKVIVAPLDLRVRSIDPGKISAKWWVKALYQHLAQNLKAFNKDGR